MGVTTAGDRSAFTKTWFRNACGHFFISDQKFKKLRVDDQKIASDACYKNKQQSIFLF